MKVETVLSPSHVSPRLSPAFMFQTSGPARTRARAPAEVTQSDPLTTLAIAFEVSVEGRGGRDRDGSQKYGRTVEEKERKMCREDGRDQEGTERKPDR